MPLYSHSKISTFEACPLKYKFSYIDKLETERGPTIEAFMGSMVHLSLEKLYTDLIFLKSHTKSDLINFYNQTWERNFDDSVVIVRREYNAEDYRKMGEKYLRDYYDHYFPFNDGKTIGCEMRVSIELKPGYVIQGYIDRLTLNREGVYEIHDYKTSAHLPSIEEIKNDRQLALYSIAVRNMFPDARRIILVWHYLAYDKEFRLEKSEKELERLKKEVLQKIHEIESTIEFKPRESALCDWCEYQSICPRRKHLFINQQKAPPEFEKEEGVRLVNDYFQLWQKKKELETQLEELRKKIYEYAEKNQADTLYGSSVKLRVWQGENIKIIDDEEKMAELIKLLKKFNLYNKIIKLDSHKFSKMIKSKELSPLVESLLKPFIKKEKIYRLYPSKFDWPQD